MAKQTRRAIAVIGDLINSKAIQNRFEFQEGFARELADIDKWQADSPYTLTLGDEFQALYTQGKGLFYDLFHIRECLYPVRCRFSIAIGEITTAINRQQAIGMDGPAFHTAREGIEHLKKNGHQLSIAGLPWEGNAMLRPAINLLWESTANWKPNRMKILRMEHEQNGDSPEQYGLAISDRAVNKNIREGLLKDWSRLIEATENEIDRLLDGNKGGPA
jgi:hypothetical protein